MNAQPAALVAAAIDPDAEPADVTAALAALFAISPQLGIAAVFDLLAREPRIKPSRALVIDPGDTARRRWAVRVAAVAALLASPAAGQVFAELADELGDSPDLARDVVAVARPSDALSVDQVAELTRAGHPARQRS